MALGTFDLLVLYKAIELVLIFWLLALLFKWVLQFVFGTKGAKIIGSIGYVINFAIKKFMLTKIFRIEVHQSDPFKLVFEHEKTDRWDILFTSVMFIPMTLGLFFGTLVGTIGLLLEEELVILSIFLYVFGFLIAVNSVPTYNDIKDLKDCSARSIVIWFIIATILCAIFAAILIPFLKSLGVIIAVFSGVIFTTIMTYFIPLISERMSTTGRASIISGTVDLDG
ncbi:MAG: hypothetical protein ACFFDW_00895 [Candidatus Thorarchaeota archaeon]